MVWSFINMAIKQFSMLLLRSVVLLMGWSLMGIERKLNFESRLKSFVFSNS